MRLKQKIVHLVSSGFIGGIETMLSNYANTSQMNNVFVFVWDKGPYYDIIKNAGHKVYFLNFRKHMIRSLFSIRRICCLEKPDYIVSHHANGVVRYLAEVGKKAANAKSVYYVHSNGENQKMKQKNIKALCYNILISYAINHADSFIAISESVSESMKKIYGISERKIRVLYNGVDTERFSMQMHKYDGITHFVYFGRLIQEKGIQVALEAFSLLPKEINWDFLIVGNGIYKERLQEISYYLGLDERVTFFDATTDIPKLIRNSDVYVHSCLCKEGFGISLVEAMAAGKICIGSNIGAIPELINSSCGFLVTPGNSEELSLIIMRVIQNIDQWKDIQEKAKQQAKKFDIKVYAKNLDEFFASHMVNL